MLAANLWFNAALYVVFGLWCALAWPRTSAAMGYLQLDGSGRSEFLTVYGGLQLGLAGFFAWSALQAPASGLVLALALYVPIVAFRAVSVLRHRPVGGVTRAVAVLEAALLVAALALWFTGAR